MRKYRCIKSTDDHKVGDICIVGGYIPEGKFDSEHFNLIQVGTPEEKAWFSQGTIYKNWEAYDKDPSEVCYIPELICYIPEMSDTKYTREDFVRLCGGNEELAREIFLEVDWQHPESLIEEWKVNGELGECKQCGWLFECYGETKCPNWKCPNCGAEWKGDD